MEHAVEYYINPRDVNKFKMGERVRCEFQPDDTYYKLKVVSQDNHVSFSVDENEHWGVKKINAR